MDITKLTTDSKYYIPDHINNMPNMDIVEIYEYYDRPLVFSTIDSIFAILDTSDGDWYVVFNIVECAMLIPTDYDTIDVYDMFCHKNQLRICKFAENTIEQYLVPSEQLLDYLPKL